MPKYYTFHPQNMTIISAERSTGFTAYEKLLMPSIWESIAHLLSSENRWIHREDREVECDRLSVRGEFTRQGRQECQNVTTTYSQRDIKGSTHGEQRFLVNKA
jgi:hypothetical protein